MKEAARVGEVVIVTIPGSLDESWRQQPDQPVYATDLDAEGVRRGLAEASRDRPPEFRAI